MLDTCNVHVMIGYTQNAEVAGVKLSVQQSTM